MTSSKTHMDDVQAVFDDWAETGRGDAMAQGHDFAARVALKHLDISANQRFLDIGCGIGYSVRWASAIDPSVQAYGLDLSSKMIDRARELTGDVPNARFINAPFPIPILKAKSFDAILSVEAFYYFDDLTWALLSTARLLKHGGLFACVVDYYEENAASHTWPERVGVDLNLLSAAQWKKAMEDIGLIVVDQNRVHHPLADGSEPDWQQTEGSLLTIAQRPYENDGSEDIVVM